MISAFGCYVLVGILYFFKDWDVAMKLHAHRVKFELVYHDVSVIVSKYLELSLLLSISLISHIDESK